MLSKIQLISSTLFSKKNKYAGNCSGILFLIIISFFVLSGCEEEYTPKPRAYFRIDLPEKEYRALKTDCPYSFEYPVYAKISFNPNAGADQCWLNVEYPSFKGRLHLSYKPVDNNLEEYLEDSRTLTYKHTVKASDIREQVIEKENSNVYGLLYDIRGNTASSLQFYLTDSTKHFLRGSLYFEVAPNKDSIAPVLEFIGEDIFRMIETFEWKY